MKKFLISATILSLIATIGTNYPILAKVDDEPMFPYQGITEEEIHKLTDDAFEWASHAPIVADKGTNPNTRIAANGTWSWRDGVICVSDSDTLGFEHGHAGIVSASWAYTTTEALNKAEGVGTRYGEWYLREPSVRCYQCGVRSTSIEQDHAAAVVADQWAIQNKPYNPLATVNQTNEFQCAQLVYEAYRVGTGVQLPHTSPWHIFPAELLHSTATDLIFRYE